MENAKIEDLLNRYRQGVAGEQDIARLEHLLETGEVGLEALHDLEELRSKVGDLDLGAPSPALDQAFRNMLKDEMGKRTSILSTFRFAYLQPLLRVAAAVLLVISGMTIGHFLDRPQVSDKRVEQLSQEIAGMKEMMMLVLLEREEATERIKAVNLARDMNHVSSKVTQALFKTLNHDGNVNVRLAALEALAAYAGDEYVREELVRSIGQQSSPLVQLALAELMVALQEKSSVEELQKILRDMGTPEEVKRKIEASILEMS